MNTQSLLAPPTVQKSIFQHLCDESEDDLGEQNCYRMEIDQLKRENNFLRKKIAELTKEDQDRHVQSAKKRAKDSSNFKPSPKIYEKKSQNYVLALFEQIKRLLQRCRVCFKLTLGDTTQTQLQHPSKILFLQNNQPSGDMNSRLNKLLLLPHQQQFGRLLAIFQVYYTETKQKQKEFKDTIQALTAEVIRIGKEMVENVTAKQNLKRSRTLSNTDDKKQRRSNDLMKSSMIKSTCTDLQLNLNSMRFYIEKEMKPSTDRQV